MKYIAVFCSAYDLEDKYTKPAKEFARLLASNGYGLVWGGTDRGLMKVIASEVQSNGGRIVGVSIPIFKEVARENADEMILAKDLGERKEIMLEKSDAIIALVGGIGTLDEVSEMIELKRNKQHNKPIVFLNIDNFYEGLKMQFKRMIDDGFINNELIKTDFNKVVYFVETPEAAIEFINHELQ